MTSTFTGRRNWNIQATSWRLVISAVGPSVSWVAVAGGNGVASGRAAGVVGGAFPRGCCVGGCGAVARCVVTVLCGPGPGKTGYPNDRGRRVKRRATAPVVHRKSGGIDFVFVTPNLVP